MTYPVSVAVSDSTECLPNDLLYQHLLKTGGGGGGGGGGIRNY